MQVIDNLKKCGTVSEVKVRVNDTLYIGWVDSKPINPRRWKTRIRDAWQVLRGRAIGVQYFDDLTETQKQEYVLKILPRIS